MKVVKVNFAEKRKPAVLQEAPARVLPFPNSLTLKIRLSQSPFTKKGLSNGH